MDLHLYGLHVLHLVVVFLHLCGHGFKNHRVCYRVLKRMIDIPVTSLSFEETAMTPVVAELEVERESFFVYCKKGKKETMEDWYSAVVDLQGDPKQTPLQTPIQTTLPGTADHSYYIPTPSEYSTVNDNDDVTEVKPGKPTSYMLMWRGGMRWTEEDGALGLLLEIARCAFSMDAMEPADGILLIVESLTMEANESDINIIESVLRVTNEENITSEQVKKIVLMFLERLCHPSYLKKFNKQQRNTEMLKIFYW